MTLEKLGTVPDRVVAEELGVNDAAVCKWRKERGVLSYRETRIDWSRIDPFLFDHLVRNLASRFDVNRGAIHRRSYSAEIN